MSTVSEKKHISELQKVADGLQKNIKQTMDILENMCQEYAKVVQDIQQYEFVADYDGKNQSMKIALNHEELMARLLGETDGNTVEDQFRELDALGSCKSNEEMLKIIEDEIKGLKHTTPTPHGSPTENRTPAEILEVDDLPSINDQLDEFEESAADMWDIIAKKRDLRKD
jgi:hypothetical protein